MISLLIQHKGTFMSKLLSSDTFDAFLLEEAVIHMAATFSIDGHLNQEFYTKEVWDDAQQRPYDFARWSDMRGYCRECIKGKTPPASLRITLQLKPEYVSKVLADVPAEAAQAVRALAVNIRMDSAGIHIVTGTAMRTFTLDQSTGPVWDKVMERFLAAKGIGFEEE